VEDSYHDSSLVFLRGKVKLISKFDFSIDANGANNVNTGHDKFIVTSLEYYAKNRPGRFRMSRWIRKENDDKFIYKDA